MKTRSFDNSCTGCTNLSSGTCKLPPSFPSRCCPCLLWHEGDAVLRHCFRILSAGLRRGHAEGFSRLQHVLNYAVDVSCGTLDSVARDCAPSVAGPIAPATAEAFLRVIVGNMDRPQVRNIAEVARSHLQRTIPTLPATENEAQPAAVTLLRATSPTPPDGDVYKCWNLPASDRLSLVVFGVSPDDGPGAVPTGGGKAGGK